MALAHLPKPKPHSDLKLTQIHQKNETQFVLSWCGLLPKAAQEAVGHLHYKSTWLAHGQRVVLQDPKVFSAELPSSLQPVLVQGLTLKYLQIQDLAFPCVDLDEIPLCPDCQGPSPWQHNPLAHQPLLPDFTSPTNFPEVHSASSSRSLMKMWNSASPSMDPWGTPLVTRLQLDLIPLITALWAGLFSFKSISLPTNLIHTLSSCLWGGYGRLELY